MNMSNFVNTGLSGYIARVVELGKYYLFNGHLYDKKTMLPVPFNYVNFAATNAMNTKHRFATVSSGYWQICGTSWDTFVYDRKDPNTLLVSTNITSGTMGTVAVVEERPGAASSAQVQVKVGVTPATAAYNDSVAIIDAGTLVASARYDHYFQLFFRNMAGTQTAIIQTNAQRISFQKFYESDTCVRSIYYYSAGSYTYAPIIHETTQQGALTDVTASKTNMAAVPVGPSWWIHTFPTFKDIGGGKKVHYRIHGFQDSSKWYFSFMRMEFNLNDDTRVNITPTHIRPATADTILIPTAADMGTVHAMWEVVDDAHPDTVFTCWCPFQKGDGYAVAAGARRDTYMYTYGWDKATAATVTFSGALNGGALGDLGTVRSVLPVTDDFKIMLMITTMGAYVCVWNSALKRYDVTISRGYVIYSAGVTADGNIYLMADVTGVLEVINPLAPSTVTLEMEKATYVFDGNPISTFCRVIATDYMGAQLAAPVTLQCGPGAVFTATGTTTVTVMTPASGALSVPMTIVTGGSFPVYASV